MSNTSKKGDIGLTKIIANLTEKDFNIFLSISESLPFDLIAYCKTTNNLYKIQVKYISSVNNKISVPLKTCSTNTKKTNNKPYNYGDFDILAVYCPEVKECLYIPKDMVKNYTSSFTIKLNDQEKINILKLFSS